MTYEQAKDQIARDWGLIDFKALERQGRPTENMMKFAERVAQLYADSVARDAWDRACEAMRKEIQTQHIYSISNVPKPEYKPK